MVLKSGGQIVAGKKGGWRNSPDWVLDTAFLANSGLALGTCPDLVSPWLLRQQFFQALTSAEALQVAGGWDFPL